MKTRPMTHGKGDFEGRAQITWKRRMCQALLLWADMG